jgi:drug/metabolite transporter (DMT)-like permease
MTSQHGITLLAVILVLASAGLHTAYNYLVKTADDKRAFTAVMVGWSAVWGLVPAIWLSCLGYRCEPLGAACALTTSLLWLAYYHYLGLSYERGDLSVAYPVIRGVAPLAAVVFGLAMGERPTLLGLLGVGVVIGALWGFAGNGKAAVGRAPNLREAVLVGILSATYSAVDKVGVEHCQPVLYHTVQLVPATVWLCLWARRRSGPGALVTALREQGRAAMMAGLSCYTAYTLVLIALTQAHVMYVVPLRATAVLFSVAAGGLALGEPQMRRRLACAVLLIGGIALVALGG